MSTFNFLTGLFIGLALLIAVSCGSDGGDDEDAAREILDANGVPTNGCSGGNVNVSAGGNVTGSVNGGCNTISNEEEDEDDEDPDEVDDPGDLPRFQTPTPLGFQ